ncbi:MAG: STAS/SEC14 domain-containing protein [Holophaga sp.]
MIERLITFPENVLGFIYKGHISKADYDSVLVPAINNALNKQERLRLYVETDATFLGIGPGAIWEDFKVGVEHLKRWERVVVVTDVEWLKNTMRLFSFLMPGAMKAFPVAESARARAWIME